MVPAGGYWDSTLQDQYLPDESGSRVGVLILVTEVGTRLGVGGMGKGEEVRVGFCVGVGVKCSVGVRVLVGSVWVGSGESVRTSVEVEAKWEAASGVARTGGESKAAVCVWAALKVSMMLFSTSSVGAGVG